ncbi:CBS domain-containing membrane protein [Albimonas donghaensis]|uniref:CBS domain-containing membrane protein n=1 Tax=Albimonas donghaensis TaxID=356660 RepID=A0A1H3CBH9_9RHOB|nr:HPP family protein [Albimonas donghaensis]SDX51456.1 CBS domain-containing membrane protein [Albimonas donghaensis]
MPNSPFSRLGALGPAVSAAPTKEVLRAGSGALVGLALVGLAMAGLAMWETAAGAPWLDGRLGLHLIAPFGASAVLLFAVPNSPLAQPWPAVVGNTIAALVGVAVCLTVPEPILRVALAVGLAVAATLLCRAVHPPAGAVAMTAALNPDAIADQGFAFALAPVATGTALLVLAAMAWARLTGRRYPRRPFDAAAEPPSPIARLGLGEAELTGILDRYRQSLNLGVEDLARLIGAAELQAAGQRAGPLTAADIMSRDLVTVRPEAPLGEIADLFRRRRFASLPVVDGQGRFLGVIFQIHLIARARNDALRLDRGFGAAMARLVDPRREKPPRAAEIMSVAGPRATLVTPIAALLPLMADGDVEAIPVLAHGRILGIVTRTDLVAALAHGSLRAPDAAPGREAGPPKG